MPTPPIAQPALSSPTPPRLLEAVAWMLVYALVIAVGNTMIRYATRDMHAFEVVFFRNLFSLLFLVPWILRSGLAPFRTSRPKLYLTRSMTTLAAMMAWFYAVSQVPLPTATAISFTTPLFTTVGAALFLGEVVRLRRWTAVLAGLVGVLIVLRPLGGLNDGLTTLSVLVLLLHCIAAAATILQMRTLAQLDGAHVVVTYMALYVTPMALVPALFVWVWPSWEQLGFLVAMGGVLTLAQLAMTRAFSLAEASAMMPYDYARLPLTALVAWAAFGEVMDLWGWIGAAVIAGSALYSAHRDAAQRRGPRATTTPAAAAE
ncbi:DMT family transporter [Azospirillum thermophilum]|nr:DMT family transporter [Azospirillum thermophilum]